MIDTIVKLREYEQENEEIILTDEDLSDNKKPTGCCIKICCHSVGFIIYSLLSFMQADYVYQKLFISALSTIRTTVTDKTAAAFFTVFPVMRNIKLIFRYRISPGIAENEPDRLTLIIHTGTERLP